MDLGDFLNTSVQDTQNFWSVLAGVVITLVIFGYFYNRRIGSLEEKESIPTSFHVVGGTLITLAIVAMISWKAAVLCLLAFAIDGAFMIVGDVARAFERVKKDSRNTRRKPLPYAAAAIIDEAVMALSDSQRMIKNMLKEGVDGKKLGLVGMQIGEAIQKLIEARKVEGE